jgi:hypothetical protein
MTRLRHTVVLVATSAVALIGAQTSLASMKVTPPCNSHAVVALDTAAAAATPSGSGATVGTAQALQLESSLRSGGGNLCTTRASAAVQSKLAAIASLYRTNRSAAHQELVTLLAEIKSGTIHTRRLASARRAEGGLCPDVSSTISVSGATQATADLSAAATAQAGGDTAGESDASAAATSAFAQWAASSGATSIGDWIAIAQAAQALGDDSLADSALDHARSAAEDAVKKATPADPCKATPSELNCFIQANAIAQMLGATGTPDLAKALDCGETWSFTMVMSGESDGGTFGTFTWKEGRFVVNRTAGTITDANANAKSPGWLGAAGGTYSCHGEGLPSESGTVSPFTFHYKLTGRIIGTKFIVQAPSSDFNLPNPFHGQACHALATLGVEVINSFVKAGIPLEFTVAPGQTTSTFSINSGGSTFHATITKLPSSS